jgi:hypothetical protein
MGEDLRDSFRLAVGGVSHGLPLRDWHLDFVPGLFEKRGDVPCARERQSRREAGTIGFWITFGLQIIADGRLLIPGHRRIQELNL